jgi:hypothetical protein
VLFTGNSRHERPASRAHLQHGAPSDATKPACCCQDYPEQDCEPSSDVTNITLGTALLWCMCMQHFLLCLKRGNNLVMHHSFHSCRMEQVQTGHPPPGLPPMVPPSAHWHSWEPAWGQSWGRWGREGCVMPVEVVTQVLWRRGGCVLLLRGQAGRVDMCMWFAVGIWHPHFSPRNTFFADSIQAAACSGVAITV